MRNLFILAFLMGATVILSQDAPKLWALLVAGSNGWYNYRHQADVCHAYQVLHAHGIPDEQIIVMMYDDLAQNDQNPTKGIVINHPMGKDVYHGVPKDYIGDDVTPENFLNILQGNVDAMQGIGSGKVVQSGPNDHVFVNFVDHGATGIVAFPNGELTATDLNNALRSMYRKKQYGKMVLYIEACESGSMFKDLLSAKMNIFATTASDYNESSYACYYDDKLQTFLGDVYSVNWMEDSDQENLASETLTTQFKIVQTETNTSHVMEYGDVMNFGKMHVGEFQGQRSAPPITYQKVPYEVSACYEAPLDILMKRRSRTNDYSLRESLNKQIEDMQRKRSYVEEVYKILAYKFLEGKNIDKNTILKTRPKAITKWDCHDRVIKTFSTNCFNLGQNPYALKFVYTLVNMCEANDGTSADIADMIKATCKQFGNNLPIPGGVH